MMMETADEMTMTLEELRRWIRGRVEKMPLISPAVLENCTILQSLLERRERQAACLLKLCKSLAACEEIVKKQYAVLGWEYRDKDSDSEDITESGDTSCSSPCESVHSENNVPTHIMNSSSLRHSKKQDFKRTREEVILNCLSQKRKAVVVLTRLPEYFSTSVPANERTEATPNSDKPAKQQNTVRLSRPQTVTCSRAARSLEKMSSQGAITKTETKETSSLSADSEGSTLCKHAETRDVLINAKVLARWRMRWQRGRITEVVKKENGKLKYKVCFEERGKGLVSGHHIALDITPEASQLCVGSCVVVRCENKASKFMSGIVTELPSETNNSSFLILMDDHKSIYATIHFLRLVFQPPKASETSPLSASEAFGIQDGDSRDSRVSSKGAVVVPHQLPAHQIDAPLPPTARQLPREDESLTGSDREMQCEPQNESDDYVHQRSKRLKAVTPKSKNLDIKDSKKNNKKDNNNDKSKSNELTEPPRSIISLPFSCQATAINKVPPDLPEEELQVNMMVLARRKGMAWFKGEIGEVFVKENEQLKYKVKLEENGRVLVSRYHLAFDRVMNPEQLFVGARVVVPSPENASCFVPGILAELPCRNNHLRFLVFLDDHTPMYLFLPALRLVCRQLPDVTGDIPDSIHRDFMKHYIKCWPRTNIISYKVGESLSVELNGVHQSCEVLQLDCSLMQVLFKAQQRKEWIHRGSFRIYLMAKFYRDTLKENADGPE